MLRLAAIALLAPCLFAQSPAPAAATHQTPPPGVDEALRARIMEFYGYFEREEYRKAEKLIAEDSQDWFYNHNKPHYLNAEIQNIQYLDNFTRAKVMALCEQNILMIGFQGPMKMPAPSTWKVVDGQWFWYVDKDELERTPWGVIKGRADAKAAPAALGLPPKIPTSADFALNLVKPDTVSVTVKPGESAKITFTNTASGPMFLSVAGKPASVDATLEHGGMNAGEKAMLTVRAAAGARSGVVEMKVMPTQERIRIEIKVPGPAEPGK